MKRDRVVACTAYGTPIGATSDKELVRRFGSEPLLPYGSVLGFHPDADLPAQRSAPTKEYSRA